VDKRKVAGPEVNIVGHRQGKSTRVTEAFSREEGPHDGITLSWVAALWDPPHRVNDQVKGGT